MTTRVQPAIAKHTHGTPLVDPSSSHMLVSKASIFAPRYITSNFLKFAGSFGLRFLSWPDNPFTCLSFTVGIRRSVPSLGRLDSCWPSVDCLLQQCPLYIYIFSIREGLIQLNVYIFCCRSYDTFNNYYSSTYISLYDKTRFFAYQQVRFSSSWYWTWH